MASAIRDGDIVVLTLSTEEALYVAAELGGGNSWFHGVDTLDDDGRATPYSVLAETLQLGASRRGPFARQYRLHQDVAAATRPTYDSEAGQAAGRKAGLLTEPAAVDGPSTGAQC